MYDIAMRFAEEAFGGEYEAVVAVHTDRNHLHAHIIINSVNMVTGYKFQYHEGKLCDDTDCTLLRQNTAKSLKIWQDHNGSVNR